MMTQRTFTALAVAAALAAWGGPAAASQTLDAALACRKGLTKMGQFYTHKRRVLLLNCIDKLLKCEVQKEVDGINPGSCRSKAETSCNNTLGSASTTALSVASDRFDTKSGAFCNAADFTSAVLFSGAGGLSYGSDVECGTSADLPSLIDCLREQLATSVDVNVGTLKPRAGILLDNMGLGADFPDIPRPPTLDVVVARTMAGESGALVSPGTLTPTSGTAVRFSGDATTLTCGGGMGNNARLTITILTLGSACNNNAAVLQEFSIKQPFGSTRTATTGPFSSDVTYCLNFKDPGSTCNETITDSIDVP
jgi:hypothetical protein